MIFSLASDANNEFKYSLLGDGYCEDYVYLPEGSYPARLNSGNKLHDDDPKQECLNRCLGAYISGAGTSGRKIGYKAFYVRPNGGCACAIGDCSTRLAGHYDSYEIIPGKF